MATVSCTSASPRKRRRIGSASPIGKLGDDLLAEILIRCLPNPRSVCRSKTVCKRWRSFLSGPCFNRRFVSHNNEQKPPPLLVTVDEPQTASMESFFCIPKPVVKAKNQYLAVLDSFKDLILCGFELPDIIPLDLELLRTLFVCNPFSKQWVALPLAPRRDSGINIRLVVKLFCEPVLSHKLDLGGAAAGEEEMVYSEYRFRVVRMYQHELKSIVLDVFCSESKAWTKGALVLDGHLRMQDKNVLSCNGLLIFCYVQKAANGEEGPPMITALNPFRLDIPPTRINVDEVAGSVMPPRWDISISQGAVHFLVFDDERGSEMGCHVWRLTMLEEEEGARRISWHKVCDGGLLTQKPWSKQDIALSDNLQKEIWQITWSGYELCNLLEPCLHPEDPRIVFFTFYYCLANDILSWDMRKGEVEFCCPRKHNRSHRWALFPLRACCWPTPIPKYKELQTMYNGRYNRWVQSSAPPTPSITEHGLVVGKRTSNANAPGPKSAVITFSTAYLTGLFKKRLTEAERKGEAFDLQDPLAMLGIPEERAPLNLRSRIMEIATILEEYGSIKQVEPNFKIFSSVKQQELIRKEQYDALQADVDLLMKEREELIRAASKQK